MSEAEHAVTVQGIDTGHRTIEVYNYCLSAQITTIPIKGDTGATTTQSTPVRVQEIDHYPNSRRLPHGRTIHLRHLHPMYFRDILTTTLKPLEVTEGQSEEAAFKALPFRIHFHEEIDNEFVSQITGEIVVTEPPDKYGNVKRYYKKIRVNDYFDCAHYALAVKYMMSKALIEMEGIESGELPKERPKRPVLPDKVKDEDDWDEEDDKW